MRDLIIYTSDSDAGYQIAVTWMLVQTTLKQGKKDSPWQFTILSQIFSIEAQYSSNGQKFKKKSDFGETDFKVKKAEFDQN